MARSGHANDCPEKSNGEDAWLDPSKPSSINALSPRLMQG